MILFLCEGQKAMPRIQGLLDELIAATSLPLNAWRAAETRNALLAIEEAHETAKTPTEAARCLVAA